MATLPRRHKYAKTVAKLVAQYRNRLFTFLDHPAGVVGAENNPAERGIRSMVVARKTSFGSRSQAGAHRRCILQTVAKTALPRGSHFSAFAAQEAGLYPLDFGSES